MWFWSCIDSHQGMASAELAGPHLRQAFGERALDGVGERPPTRDDVTALTRNRKEAANRSQIRASGIFHAYPLIECGKAVTSVT